jgi:hypothetical protein
MMRLAMARSQPPSERYRRPSSPRANDSAPRERFVIAVHVELRAAAKRSPSGARRWIASSLRSSERRRNLGAQSFGAIFLSVGACLPDQAAAAAAVEKNTAVSNS